MAPRLGFVFLPTMAPSLLVPLARAVEHAGFDDLWVWEDCFDHGAISASGLALGATDRITVGIGLMPVPLRNVALTAMELATLAGAAPGRLIGGIGHGVLDWMGRVGVRAEAPLTLLREYAVALRALLDGEEVDARGRYVHLESVKLGWAPQMRVPVMIGGTRPRTLRAVGELGDGLLLATGASLDEIRAAIRHARAGGAPSDFPVVVSLVVATGPGAEERAARDLAVWTAFGEGDGRGAAVGGTAEQIADAVRALEAAGASTVILQATGDEPDPEGLAAWLGAEVVPLLRG